MLLELEAAEGLVDTLELFAAYSSHHFCDVLNIVWTVKRELVAVDRRVRVYNALAAQETMLDHAYVADWLVLVQVAGEQLLGFNGGLGFINQS